MIETLARKAVKNSIEIYVLSNFSVSKDDLFGISRKKEIVMARQVYWWLLRNRLKYSYPFIAGLFKKDHTTVMHGIRAGEESGLFDKVRDDLGKKVPVIKIECVHCGKENIYKL